MCDDVDLSDTSKWREVPNPFVEILTKELTFRLDHTSIAYFQDIGDKIGEPAERVMNMFLRNIAATGYCIEIEGPRGTVQARAPAPLKWAADSADEMLLEK